MSPELWVALCSGLQIVAIFYTGIELVEVFLSRTLLGSFQWSVVFCNEASVPFCSASKFTPQADSTVIIWKEGNGIIL